MGDIDASVRGYLRIAVVADGAVARLRFRRVVDTPTEVLWAALHGLTTLSRNNRLRPGHDTDRIDLLITQFRAARS